MKPPIEAFLRDALKDFDKYLKQIGDKPQTIKHRERGARQFVEWLLGHQYAKGERLRDRAACVNDLKLGHSVEF